jgi:hypothetical protein
VCLVAAGVVLGAGCGGGAGALTHREFTRHASRVCDRANRRVGTQAGSLAEPAAAASLLTKVIDVERDTVADLRRLAPPVRDFPRVDEWLAVQAQLDAELDTLRAALRAKQHAPAVVALDHATILAGRASALARANGIRPCRTPLPRPS